MRLAVDVGSVRVGVARSDPGGVLATPLTVLASGPGAKAAQARAELARLAASEGAIEIIVGLPTSLSGREGAGRGRGQGVRGGAGRTARAGPGPAGRRAVHHHRGTRRAATRRQGRSRPPPGGRRRRRGRPAASRAGRRTGHRPPARAARPRWRWSGRVSENGGGWPQSPRPPRHSRGSARSPRPAGSRQFPGPRAFQDPRNAQDPRAPGIPGAGRTPAYPRRRAHLRSRGCPRGRRGHRGSGPDAWRPDEHLRPLPPGYEPVHHEPRYGETRPAQAAGPAPPRGLAQAPDLSGFPAPNPFRRTLVRPCRPATTPAISARGTSTATATTAAVQRASTATAASTGSPASTAAGTGTARPAVLRAGPLPGRPGAAGYEDEYGEAGDKFVPGFGEEGDNEYEQGRSGHRSRRARRTRPQQRRRRAGRPPQAQVPLDRAAGRAAGHRGPAGGGRRLRLRPLP